MSKRKKDIFCSFCGRTRNEAPQMISSPSGVYICADCVHLCSKMVDGNDMEGVDPGEFGIPDSQFLVALLGFNIGVEIGQLTVILICFALVGWAFGRKPWYRRVITTPASVAIAVIGAYWVVERTLL